MARRNTLEEGYLTDAYYYLLLCMLKPIHGYAMMERVKEISDNSFEIGPANLYTSLKKLLDARLIRLVSEEQGERKTYEIQKKGKTLLMKDYLRRKEMVSHAEKVIKGMGDYYE
ncbi:PadR family transcriptional regulator [Haloimpatiens massiliensis]|uniref:PadR family transcriptional regulator n=1 Tax=Haloimpatiens massiliensis TaxID=1658110 RepID=UPI000C853DD6|nr:helix-turn-helix transcriptional regulator [Haloimpatiens massiliensis]